MLSITDEDKMLALKSTTEFKKNENLFAFNIFNFSLKKLKFKK